MNLILEYLDSFDNYALLTFRACECGCGQYDKIMFIETSMEEQDILTLEISVDNINPVQVSESILYKYESDFRLNNVMFGKDRMIN